MKRVIREVKKRIKEPKITYEVVGTKEENQEVLDRVFDRIFDEVLRKREKRSLTKKIGRASEVAHL